MALYLWAQTGLAGTILKVSGTKILFSEEFLSPPIGKKIGIFDHSSGKIMAVGKVAKCHQDRCVAIITKLRRNVSLNTKMLLKTKGLEAPVQALPDPIAVISYGPVKQEQEMELELPKIKTKDSKFVKLGMSGPLMGAAAIEIGVRWSDSLNLSGLLAKQLVSQPLVSLNAIAYGARLEYFFSEYFESGFSLSSSLGMISATYDIKDYEAIADFSSSESALFMSAVLDYTINKKSWFIQLGLGLGKTFFASEIEDSVTGEIVNNPYAAVNITGDATIGFYF